MSSAVPKMEGGKEEAAAEGGGRGRGGAGCGRGRGRRGRCGPTAARSRRAGGAE